MAVLDSLVVALLLACLNSGALQARIEIVAASP